MESDSSLTDLSSSELSSVGSLSPCPDYPSPVSFQEQDLLQSISVQIPKKHKLEGQEEQRAPKKRKKIEPKPRTTQYLDLTGKHKPLETQQEQLDTLLKVLRKRKKIVVVAGAGISVSAGVPDFRSSNGLFKSLKTEHKLKASGKQLFDASVYQTDSSTSSFHDMVRRMFKLVSEAKPTAFHDMLSDLGLGGRLLRLYTQNVDGLDAGLPGLETEIPLSMKGPWPTTVQLHGGLDKMSCSKCSKVVDFDPTLFNGPKPPFCKFCADADRVRTDHAGKRSHGIGRLRPRMVLYNERNPDEDAIGSVVSADLRTRPDAIIVVGTSMKIPGVRRIVREMCGVVRDRRDGLAIWINRDGPPPGKEFEDCWDLVVKGPCDEVANQFNLSFEPQNSHRECTNSDLETAKEKTDVEVRMPSPTKHVTQMLTPAASPAPKPVEVKKLKLKLKPPPEDTKEKKGLSSKPKRSKAGQRPKSDKAPSKPKSRLTGAMKNRNALVAEQKQPYSQLTSSFKITKPTDFLSTTTTTKPSKPKSKSKSSSRSGTSTPRKPQQEPIQLSSPPATSPRLPPHRLFNIKPSPTKHSPSKGSCSTHHRSPSNLSGPLFPHLKLDPDPPSNKGLPQMYFTPLELSSHNSPSRTLPHRPSLSSHRSISGSSNDSHSSSIRSILSTTKSFKPSPRPSLLFGLDGPADLDLDLDPRMFPTSALGGSVNRRISSSPPPYSPLTSPVLGPVDENGDDDVEALPNPHEHIKAEKSVKAKCGKNGKYGRISDSSTLSELSVLSSLAESEERFITAVEQVEPESRGEASVNGERSVGVYVSENGSRSGSGRSSGSGGGSARLREGTVSPVSVPRGMENLLCT